MPCDVSSWWLAETEKPAPTPRRRFTIGTSDYTERVDRFPKFQRTANEIKSININLPLANADGALNHFYQNTYTIPNTCTLEIGVEINKSGNEGFLKHTGQTGEYTPGNVLYGISPGSGSPGAAGTVEFNGENCVYLSGLTSGTFVDGMIICEGALGSELLTNWDFSDGDLTGWNGSGLETMEYVASYQGKSHLGHIIESSGSFNGLTRPAITLIPGAFYKREAYIYIASASGAQDVRILSYNIWEEGDGWASRNYGSGETGAWITVTNYLQCKNGGSQAGAVVFQVKNNADAHIDYGSTKQTTNAAKANGGIYQSHDEYIKLFTGFLKNVRYAQKKCVLKIKDRLWDFTGRKVGDSDAHVDIGSTIPSDIAWTLCTCYGGLSAVASTSNPDIDYSKFSTWAAQFSQDSVLMSANYQGIKITEALTSLAEMTDSAIWIEGDGKLNFVKFIEPSSLDITFTRDKFADILIDVESLRLINKHYTSFDYSVESEYWQKTVFSQETISVNSFGLHEQTQKDESIWHVDSLSALGLSQRKVNLFQDPPKRFGFSTGIYGMHKQLGETVRLVDSFYNITSASGWRTVETDINMQKGIMQFNLDEATVMNAFYLDVSNLDGDDLLV